ncbi:MAG: FecR family protein [Gammaproteobacteria bacterium]
MGRTLPSGESSPAERRVFEIWLAQSDTHRQAYQKADAFWRDLGAYQALPFPELARARARYATPPRRWFPAVALALTAVLIVIVVLAPPWSSNLIDTYRTAKGERRTVPLPDGSRLALDTDTAVTVDFDRDLRRLDLLQGEIAVTVAHESARPFDIFAGAGHIRDLGTQFDVYAEPGAVSVVVIEGTVSVETNRTLGRPQALTRGQQLSYDGRGVLSPIERADIAAVTAWQEGRVVFKDRPLREVLAQISRYHAVEFLLDDRRLENLKVSGTFHTADLKIIVDTLAASLSIRVEELGHARLRLRADLRGCEKTSWDRGMMRRELVK